ncbi:uncharacterized protein LOC130184179 isoform X3 [Seriola aureovittata]|uniref:uncharacterized protein LOC130184179 isoform X3 n=1 Tax=Seriola aureovittata TaxID=2871759 RepID=UPI0024BE001F|nr:uncharacterized protein LOC130184179 isoform X3 [Seriola aureovittata]
MLNPIMIIDLLWMILPVFLVCAEAENVTEVEVKLGHNITLSCSTDISNIYWYMQIYGQLSVFIGRTFSGNHEHNYCSPSLKTKYSLRENTLVITNVTAGDCRFYFCAKKIRSNISYVDTFRLVSDVPPTPPTNDSQPDQHQEQHNWTIWQSNYVMYGSLTLNAFFILVTIGLAFALLCLKKKKKKRKKQKQKEKDYNHQVNDSSLLIYENIQIPVTVQN